MINATYTLAFRKGSANHFKRANNWTGTWAQARELARIFQNANPGLEVWYVAAADSEGTHEEDRGNILTDKGKRIKMRETGVLSPEILAQVPGATEAQERWLAGCDR